MLRKIPRQSVYWVNNIGWVVYIFTGYRLACLYPSYNGDYRGIKDLLFDKIVHDIIWRNIEFKFR
jgi:hypothetical protein